MEHAPTAATTEAGRISVGHAKIDDLGFDQAVNVICDLARARAGAVVVTPNIQHIAYLERDRDLQESYSAADLVLPDGWPVVLAMRLSGGVNRERVPGSDLIPALCVRAARDRLSVAFVGGQPGAAAEAARRMEVHAPGVGCALVADPSPGFEADRQRLDELVASINDAAPDLVFLGLGTPKQEVLIHRLRSRLDVGVTLCLGAGIDFIAGAQQRAPVAVQTLGLEWAHRVLQEPRRMLPRYARSLPLFIRAAARTTRRQRVPGRGVA